MWGFNYVTDIPNSLQFILYYVIGAYVDHDELEVDNFVIFGSEASITLTKVHAKPSKFNEILGGSFGVNVRGGLLESIKVAVAWKSLLNGILSIEINGAAFSMDCEGGAEPTVWYDAMTESVYENSLQWNGSINLENLSEELEEIMTEVSSSASESEDYERDIQYFKGILEKLLTNLTLIVRDIKLNLEINDDVSIEASIESISLSDMTEEVRSREPLDVCSNESILLSKQVLIGPISVNIKKENQIWKLIECTEADSTSPMTGEMNLFKSGHCEVLVKTGNLSAFLAPDYITITDSILRTFAKGKKEEDDSSGTTSRNIIGGIKFSIGFIKVSIENMTLVLSESPLFYDSSSSDPVYEINFEACELITFPSSDQPRSISFSALKYSVRENAKILSESHLVPALQVCVDEKGLQVYVKDKVELKVDQGVWSLAEAFLKLRRQKEDAGEGSGGLPFILQCPELKLVIDGVLLERKDPIEATILNAIFSGNGKSSSFSFESSHLVAGLTKIGTGATTISKSLFDVAEGAVEFSPFDPLYSSIEGQRFVHISSFDKACALQDRIQLSTRKHNLISSRSIVIETIDGDIVWLKSLFKRLSGLRSSTTKAKNVRSASKFICGSLKMDIQICNVSYSISISEIVHFMANHQSVRISDLRADLDYLTRDGEVLGKKILTLSLDGSIKGFVLTEQRKLNEKPLLAGQISGIEFILPISLDLSSELKFLDDLVGSDVLLPPSDHSGLHFDGHFNLYKCSVTPSFPSSWPKCHASSVYSNSIRMIVNSKEHLKLYQQNGVLFVSKRSADNQEIAGIYGDGHSYWQEKGYAPICEINFLQVNLEKLASYLQLTLENQDVLVELCEDSALVAKNYFNYLSNIPRYAALNSKKSTAAAPEVTPKKEDEPKDLLKDVDDMMFMGPLNEHADEEEEETEGEGPPVGKKFSQLDIEENFFKPTVREDANDEEIVEGDFACVQPSNDWEALIELPINPKPNEETLVVRSNDSVLVFGSSHSPQDAVHVKSDKAELEIDEDYFSRPIVSKDSFPFSREPFKGTFRLKLVDFTVTIKLVEGHKFSRHHQGKSAEEKTPLMHSFGMSPLSPAALSVAPSKWTESSSRHTRLPEGSKVRQQDAVEVILDRINCEVDWGQLNQEEEGSTEVVADDKGLMDLRLVIRKVEILDQVKASRWKTILTRRLEEEEETPLRDEFGALLEDSMVRCELSAVQVAGPEEAMRVEDRVEYRLKVRVLPMRVHLDQDALKFVSKFFSSFSAADSLIDESDQVQVEPLFFQHCDIAEIRVRLDYKPKKIDFCRVALGRYAELLNLFQLEDAELSLPAVRLRGVKGARQFTADLVRSWLPFIKNKQIPKMLSGVGPVRTVINLGSGVSDLILLPMRHYQRDGRLIRGVRKGTSSFLHSTVLEGAKLGSKLAVGTQVILEQVDDIFEGSNEAAAAPHEEQSKFAAQPEDIREGLVSAYQSLATNLTDAMQTIVAVPVQVYERSGPSGAIKAVIRAVPIAVLKPMIGATEALGKTLMGIENSMDPSRGIEINRKYKRQNKS